MSVVHRGLLSTKFQQPSRHVSNSVFSTQVRYASTSQSSMCGLGQTEQSPLSTQRHAPVRQPDASLDNASSHIPKPTWVVIHVNNASSAPNQQSFLKMTCLCGYWSPSSAPWRHGQTGTSTILLRHLCQCCESVPMLLISYDAVRDGERLS